MAIDRKRTFFSTSGIYLASAKKNSHNDFGPVFSEMIANSRALITVISGTVLMLVASKCRREMKTFWG